MRVAQLLRLEHLELRAEAQKLAVGVAEMREGEHRPAFVVDPRLAREPAPHVLVDPHRHLDTGATPARSRVTTGPRTRAGRSRAARSKTSASGRTDATRETR